MNRRYSLMYLFLRVGQAGCTMVMGHASYQGAQTPACSLSQGQPYLALVVLALLKQWGESASLDAMGDEETRKSWAQEPADLTSKLKLLTTGIF
jgi:hypothetical protein